MELHGIKVEIERVDDGTVFVLSGRNIGTLAMVAMDRGVNGEQAHDEFVSDEDWADGVFGFERFSVATRFGTDEARIFVPDLSHDPLDDLSDDPIEPEDDDAWIIAIPAAKRIISRFAA